jgi:hypothetical protein
VPYGSPELRAVQTAEEMLAASLTASMVWAEYRGKPVAVSIASHNSIVLAAEAERLGWRS